DLSTSIDVPAERARLTRDRAVAEKDLEQTAKKLGNAAFLAKAPDDVVAGIRARNAKAGTEISRIDAALAALAEA
ncbi:MAG: valine--tRNA ligase, partial [Frankiales bacterium]|nr:valine--tRNA ligase [Frankiales bacterium]